MSDETRDFPPPNADERAAETNGPAPTQPAPAQAAPVQARPAGFKRGFGMGIGLGLGLTIMMVVLAIIGGIFSVISLGALVAAGTPEATKQTTAVWGEAGASGKLRAISISGPILTDGSSGSLFAAGAYGYEIAAQLDELTADDADGVVLLVNTPGGTITGSKAISDAVARYQDRTGNKVIAHVEGMSASGGVYATATADEIISDHGSLVGSIGVIFGPFSHYEDVTAVANLTDGVVQAGSITQEYLAAGEGKDFGNPYREMTEEERQVMTEMLTIEYDNFVSHVSEHRGIPADTIVNELGAHVFDPATAQEHGLVDGVMGREEFFRHAAEQSGLDPDDTVVERITPPTGLSALLGATRAHGQSLPLASLEGSESLVSQTFCGQRTPLVFAGDLQAVCGGR